MDLCLVTLMSSRHLQKHWSNRERFTQISITMNDFLQLTVLYWNSGFYLCKLCQFVSCHLDPYQFVYKHNRSTEDTTHTLLHNAYTHLEKTGSFVRTLLIDFSSGFNTIQPHLMASKLLEFNVNFLVSCSQTVRHQATLLSSCSISTSSLQGTVLSPISFYTLYKWLHRHWHNTSHKILWRFCNGRSFQLGFCLFCWSWKVQ